MNPGQRVSFQLAGKTAYGSVVMAQSLDRYIVAVDPQYMQGSQGTVNICIWIPSVSLTAVG